MNTIENTLYLNAEEIRTTSDFSEFSDMVLGILFIRYVSASFEKLNAQLEMDVSYDAENRDEYLSKSIFWLPRGSRWSEIVAASSKVSSIGDFMDHAMRAIEEANPSLNNTLPKVYGGTKLSNGGIISLIDLFKRLEFDGDSRDYPVFLRIYLHLDSNYSSLSGKVADGHLRSRSQFQRAVKACDPRRAGWRP